MTFRERYKTMSEKTANRCDSLMDKLEQKAPKRSAWERGVKAYAVELVEALAEGLFHSNSRFPINSEALLKAMLNGADNWRQYSEGGCSLIYNSDIAQRMCNPTELKRNHNGERNPNKRDNWQDIQTRALFQAGWLICKLEFPTQRIPLAL